MSRRGRPMEEPKAKRVQISCITSAELKRRLMAAAELNGRTISSEVAARIEWTFDMPRQFRQIQDALRAVLQERA